MKWLLMGAGLGVVVYLLGRVVIIVMFVLGYTGFGTQDPYVSAAANGIFGLIMQLLLLAIATLIGEELAFRGVIANVLLRYGPWIGIHLVHLSLRQFTDLLKFFL
ncbi:membrane protease YdiL (CAAX protease family) [Cytobacillus purgationiresistens]|uniref:Membrane protease YdiL (CAAX protease family) n=1 Tax=Cytobacillus purgationiresistens TaxID=863449 RepID=A0ABU0AQX0_9BACI|nr:membrane protease YdiL (CAAX protease family) [Cytobacillus purgationiresistens]